MSKAIALNPRQINRCLKLIKLMQNPEIKRAAFVLSHAAMRVTEIARIQVKSLVHSDGSIRLQMLLPADICKGLKTRRVWLTNPKTREIIQDYIDHRIKKKWGLSLASDDYQGMEPDSKFLYNSRGMSYGLNNKPRKMKDKSIKVYKACDSLENIFRIIYQKCGYKDASSHTGRKSLVTNSVLRDGATLEQCARMLGHADAQTTLHYVQIDRKRIEQMYGIVQTELFGA